MCVCVRARARERACLIGMHHNITSLLLLSSSSSLSLLPPLLSQEYEESTQVKTVSRPDWSP